MLLGAAEEVEAEPMDEEPEPEPDVVEVTEFSVEVAVMVRGGTVLDDSACRARNGVADTAADEMRVADSSLKNFIVRGVRALICDKIASKWASTSFIYFHAICFTGEVEAYRPLRLICRPEEGGPCEQGAPTSERLQSSL